MKKKLDDFKNIIKFISEEFKGFWNMIIACLSQNDVDNDQ